MHTPRKPGESELAYFSSKVAMASFSAMVSEAATIPFDTAKVRLMI